MYRPSTKTISIGILCSLVCLVILRVPEIICTGRFWAEEGTIYFREAYMSAPSRVLLTANLGYYSLYNKLAAILAAHAVPLTLAPVVTALFALVAQIIPFMIILCSTFAGLSSIWRKIGACLLVLLVQPNQEVWLNTINSQFYFCISCALILISQTHRTQWHVFRLSVLAMAGLTGVVSCMLFPFFAIAYARSRSAHRLQESIVLGLACAMQAFVVMTTEGRETAAYLNVLPFALLVKQWLLPFAGESIATLFGHFITSNSLYQNWVLASAALLPYIVFGTAILAYGRLDALLLLFSSLGIASLSFLKSLEAQQLESLLLHVSSASGAGRYYFAPNALLGLSLLMSPRKRRLCSDRFRRAYGIVSGTLVVLLLVVGASDYARTKRHGWFFKGPSWTEQVRTWHEGTTDSLSIWPHGWQMTLPRKEGEWPNKMSGGDGK